MRFFRTLTMGSTVCALAFATLAAAKSPVVAQTITVKCWKEICITDPETNKESCVREQIPCPTEQ
jgi:hypothetical protein